MICFATAATAAFAIGDAVALDDGRRGHVTRRWFRIGRDGASHLDFYSVMLRGGIHVAVAPARLAPSFDRRAAA